MDPRLRGGDRKGGGDRKSGGDGDLSQRDLLPRDLSQRDLSQLRQLIIQKWPEAVLSKDGLSEPIFHTGISRLDALFPRQGIPYGQLIEITGAVGCGKTSLLFMMLATLTKSGTVAYIDLSGSFFPAAAASCGVDIEKLSVVKPDNFVMGLRSAELLLSHQMVDSVVVDLTCAHPSTALRVTGKPVSRALRAVKTTNLSCKAGPSSPARRGVNPPPSSNLLHRLRQQVSRSKALVIFLTDNSSDSRQFLPASMVALRLEVSRLVTTKDSYSATLSQRVGSGLDPDRSEGATQGRTLREENTACSRINVTVTKSRISAEGAHAEVLLNE